MKSDNDTGLSERQLAHAIITSRELAESFITRYMRWHNVDRQTAKDVLARWNINISNLPKDKSSRSLAREYAER